MCCTNLDERRMRFFCFTEGDLFLLFVLATRSMIQVNKAGMQATSRKCYVSLGLLLGRSLTAYFGPAPNYFVFWNLITLIILCKYNKGDCILIRLISYA